jgi:WD40 repeat protein
MKDKLRTLPVCSHTAQVLFSLIVFQFPVIGYCDSGSGWVNSLLGSKGKSMKEVAVKVAELHEDVEIWGLDFSLDGKYLAATSPTTLEVQIWDWQNKRIVRTLEKAQGAGLATEIVYSPNGHLLVACHSRAADDIVARIWNTDTWEIVHDIVDHIPGSGCNAIGFTPDGKSLIRVLDRLPDIPGDNLIIYATDTWQPVWGLRTVPFYPKALSISPDGKFVAIGGEVRNPRQWPFSTPQPTFGTPPLSNQSAIVVVDLVQRTIIRTMQNTVEFDFGRLAWSPDGAYITAMGRRAWDGSANDGHGAFIGGPDTVMVFDAHSGKQIAGEKLEGVSNSSLRYTPGGKYLIEGDMDALGNGLGVRIWDGQHRELLQVISGNVGSLAVSRDGHYFAAGGLKDITVWQLK